jgi:hypothetical protein
MGQSFTGACQQDGREVSRHDCCGVVRAAISWHHEGRKAEILRYLTCRPQGSWRARDGGWRALDLWNGAGDSWKALQRVQGAPLDVGEEHIQVLGSAGMQDHRALWYLQSHLSDGLVPKGQPSQICRGVRVAAPPDHDLVAGFGQQLR